MENNQTQQNEGNLPTGQSKQTWRKPEIRTLRLAFTKSGGSGPYRGKEEDINNPNTAGYMPDS